MGDSINNKDSDTFGELARTFIEKHRINKQHVNGWVTKYKKYTKKADEAYYNFFKKCIDDFLSEEERIFEEVSQTLDHDETMDVSLEKHQEEIEKIIEETNRLLEESDAMRKRVETINQRIQDYEKMMELIKTLESTISIDKDIIVPKRFQSISGQLEL